MRLLKATDGSVLWLSQPNEIAAANLRRFVFLRALGDQLRHAGRRKEACPDLAGKGRPPCT